MYYCNNLEKKKRKNNVNKILTNIMMLDYYFYKLLNDYYKVRKNIKNKKKNCLKYVRCL